MTLQAMRSLKGIAGAVCLVAGLAAGVDDARALSIELKDIAADRIDRQRSFQEGALPLPGTPNIAILDQRLKEQGVAAAAPMVIRIFKMESELEIWKEKGGEYVRFATYPICHWSGSLGPKLREGDKQAPEGFYTVTRKQLHHVGRWPRSLYLNFPNVFDQALARTGAHILIHGGCTSVGCFAMTNPVMEEIHRLTSASIDGGQVYVPIHVFPFRMTAENIKANATSPWAAFWANLKEGYDLFEKSKRPPRVNACDGKYTFTESPGIAESGPLEACDTLVANIREQDQWLDGLSANTPVRTAAATAAQPAPGDARSLTDAVLNGDVQSETGPEIVTDAVQQPETQPEKVLRCRFAHKVCRNWVTLESVQAARRAARLAAGLRNNIGVAVDGDRAANIGR